LPELGKQRIACKVQNDMGGKGLWSPEIKVGCTNGKGALNRDIP
jgi:hypothetical protein